MKYFDKQRIAATAIAAAVLALGGCTSGSDGSSSNTGGNTSAPTETVLSPSDIADDDSRLEAQDPERLQGSIAVMIGGTKSVENDRSNAERAARIVRQFHCSEAGLPADCDLAQAGQ